MPLRSQFALHGEYLMTEFTEARTQVVKAIEDIWNVVGNQFTKATSRKKTDVKDTIDALLGYQVLCGKCP